MNAFSVTNVGKVRKSNQDSVFRSETPIGNLPNLFIVADGMGGHNGGDEASRLCIDSMCEYINNEKEEQSIIPIMEGAIRFANSVIYEKSLEDPGLSGMGTTVVAAVIDNGVLYVANVGDSRLYYVEGDSLRQITEDHSLVEEMVKKGDLDRSEARFHPNKNIITRAIGVGKVIDIDYFELHTAKGGIVLLCSDGLSNMLSDSEIVSAIKSGDGQADIIARTLVDKANDNGGKDNITVIVILL
ncbi:MAG: Stp1/IreP family PP2C-type Ser/Thr phosphatase [Lachnospiraceae bacterium]|nr:Stp1/IreP family PP2C-type Ser/Thr phosphatase [Lachnospiraceae bacterium]